MSWFVARPRHAEPAPAIRAVRSDPPVDAQGVWFALEREPWTSLAVLAADDSCDTASVASALVAIGSRNGRPLLLLSGATLDLERSASLTSHLRQRAVDSSVIVALGPLDAFPSGVSVARAAERTVLCVTRGVTKLAAVRSAMELVGRDKVLGYVVIEGKARR